MHYKLHGLLDGNQTLTQNYENGSYISIYLAPYNYHRVHAPIQRRSQNGKYGSRGKA
jgi:Phosphatidylserine decarboxylase